MPEIKLTPTELRSAADAIENRAANIKQNVVETGQLIARAIDNGRFQGNRAGHLISHYHQLQPTMEGWPASMALFAAQLREAADKFEKADQAEQASQSKTSANTPPEAHKPAASQTPASSTYTVVSGDNLTVIARRYGTTVDALVKANHIANPNLIYPEQVLVIPGANGSNTPNASVSPNSLVVSDQGARLIAQFEGFSGQLYNDPAGHTTIGYGHLVHTGNVNGSEPAEFRAGISQEHALQLLKSDVSGAAQTVSNMVKVPLNQNQFDALTSFVFNVGSGNFQNSALLSRLNAGDYAAVPGELNRWIHGGNRVLDGLVSRRQAEGNLFSK